MQLGATLYVPASRSDLLEIAGGQKIPHLRSMIICTEDAVAEDQLDSCLGNVQAMLLGLTPSPMQRFIRVRNLDILRQLLSMVGIEQIDGFVIPKVSPRNWSEYEEALLPLEGYQHMLTLETRDVFEPNSMRRLRNSILVSDLRSQILSLRIGGNDLFQCLGMRRPRDFHAYDTPLGQLISQLVNIFRPYGFQLTAPVFDWFDRPDLLMAECRLDLAHGLFSKSAIHPDQIPLIEKNYRVPGDQYDMAVRVCQTDAPPVFRFGKAMCEVNTHGRWAQATLARAEIFGIDA